MFASFIIRLRALLHRDVVERELKDELRSHLEREVERNIARGMTPGDAAMAARRAFGNVTRAREEARDAWTWRGLEQSGQDIRYALRATRRSPVFTLVAVLSLALGIGGNTAIFSLVNAVVLKSLPVSHPEELLAVGTRSGDGTTSDLLTNPLWEEIRNRPDLFAGSLAYSIGTFNLATGGESRPTAGSFVSGGFFAALGVRAVAGRLLQPGDDVRGCPAVAVVSQAFAQSEYGSAGGAAGKIVSLNGHPFEVIGVIEAAFFGMVVGQTANVYAPICSMVIWNGRPDFLDVRDYWTLYVMGRAKPGATVAQLKARLALASPAIFGKTVPPIGAMNPQAWYRSNVLDVWPAAAGLSGLRDTYARALVILMAFVGVVLLIACANIANLLLARAAVRQREIAIRLAIGAGRWRLVRQFLTESLLLSFGGAVLGVIFARWAMHLLVGFLPSSGGPVWLDLSLDGRVLAFTIAVATVTGVLFGLAPAWRAARVDPQTALRSNGRGATGRGARLRVGRALVVGQIGLSLTLVALAGLLVGSFERLVTLDPGFRRDGVLLIQLNLSRTGFKGQDLATAETELLRRIRDIPGVTSASLSAITPITQGAWNNWILVPGYAPVRMQDSLVYLNQVSDGYFGTLATALIAGRDISPDDIAQSRHVAVINETMARQIFGAAPLGRTFHLRGDGAADPPTEVVGVVQDAKYRKLDEVTVRTAYLALPGGASALPFVNAEIRVAGPVVPVVQQFARLATSVSPSVGYSIKTLAAQVSESIMRPRLLAVLSGFFGALALLLTMVGLYGTMSYDVTQRRNEIGIRLALGAGRMRIVRTVIGDAGRLIAAGIIIGIVLALASMRLVASFLYGVTPTDLTNLALSATAVAAVGMAAAFLPMSRAIRLAPMDALREE